jgi:hypothetical protein
MSEDAVLGSNPLADHRPNGYLSSFPIQVDEGAEPPVGDLKIPYLLSE